MPQALKVPSPDEFRVTDNLKLGRKYTTFQVGLKKSLKEPPSQAGLGAIHRVRVRPVKVGSRLQVLATSGIVRRITGTGYLVCTGSEQVRTGTYRVQTGTGNE